MIKAKAFGKYPVIVKNIYDEYGTLYAVCETENRAFIDYLLSDLVFEARREHTDSNE